MSRRECWWLLGVVVVITEYAAGLGALGSTS